MIRLTASSQTRYFHFVVGVLATLPAANQLRAQCPVAPTTHPNGVIEGPVTCIADQSTNGSLGIDDQGRFIAGFERPLGTGFQVYAQRFNAVGMPIGAAAPLSDSSFASDFHHFPSVAMSRDSRVRVGWLARRFSIVIQPPDHWDERRPSAVRRVSTRAWTLGDGVE